MQHHYCYLEDISRVRIDVILTLEENQVFKTPMNMSTITITTTSITTFNVNEDSLFIMSLFHHTYSHVEANLSHWDIHPPP